MRDVAQQYEVLLARLFTDPALRERFRREPEAVGREAGLDEDALRAFAHADWVGLDLAARSYAHKRAGRAARKSRAKVPLI